MKPHPSHLLTLLIGLTVGILVTLVVGASDSSNEVVLETEKRLPDGANGLPADFRNGAARSPAQQDQNDGPDAVDKKTTSKTANETTTEVALARLRNIAPDPEPYPRGEHRVTGSVFLEDGTPLEGVQVSLWLVEWGETTPKHDPPRKLDERAFRSGIEGSDEEAVLRTLAFRKRKRTDTLTTTTDENGKYHFEGLGEMHVQVTVHKQGYQLGDANVVDRSVAWARGRSPGTYDFRATPISHLNAIVLLPDGSAAPYAELVFERDVPYAGWSDRVSWRSDASIVQLVPGTYKVRAEADIDTLAYVSERSELSVSAGGGQLSLELQLKLICKVVFRVKSEAAFRRSATAYVRGYLTPIDTPTTANPYDEQLQQWNWNFGLGEHLVTRTGDPKLSTEQIITVEERGRLFLQPYMEGKGYGKRALEGEQVFVDLLPGTQKITLKLPAPDRQRFAEVTLLDANGNAIRSDMSFEVRTPPAEERYMGQYSRSSSLQPAYGIVGEDYWLVLLPEYVAGDRNWTLRAKDLRRNRSVSLTFAPAENLRLTLRFE